MSGLTYTTWAESEWLPTHSLSEESHGIETAGA
jgi:hypothetical protein